MYTWERIRIVGIKSLWEIIFKLKIKNKEYNTVSIYFLFIQNIFTPKLLVQLYVLFLSYTIIFNFIICFILYFEFKNYFRVINNMDFKKKVQFRKKLHEDFASLKLSLDENSELTWPCKEQIKKLKWKKQEQEWMINRLKKNKIKSLEHGKEIKEKTSQNF